MSESIKLRANTIRHADGTKRTLSPKKYQYIKPRRLSEDKQTVLPRETGINQRWLWKGHFNKLPSTID